MNMKITRLDTYVLIQACHCRMAEIDKSVSSVFAEMSEKQPDQTSVSAIIALDGERAMVERMLHRLWEHSKGPYID